MLNYFILIIYYLLLFILLVIILMMLNLNSTIAKFDLSIIYILLSFFN